MRKTRTVYPKDFLLFDLIFIQQEGLPDKEHGLRYIKTKNILFTTNATENSFIIEVSQKKIAIGKKP